MSYTKAAPTPSMNPASNIEPLPPLPKTQQPARRAAANTNIDYSTVFWVLLVAAGSIAILDVFVAKKAGMI